MKNVAKNGRGAFHTFKDIIRGIKLLGGVSTKFTIYRSKNIRGIKLKKKYRGTRLIWVKTSFGVRLGFELLFGLGVKWS